MSTARTSKSETRTLACSAGACSFGLPVAWVNRAGAPVERLGAPPSLVVPDLAALAAAIG